MVLYWNDVFWYYDKMNKKKCKPEFVLVRKLYIPSVSETVSIKFYGLMFLYCVNEILT